MAINSVTDFRNTDPGQTALTVANSPAGGSSGCHAMQVTQGAASGTGGGLSVVSNNASASAIVARGAGALLQLYDADRNLKFQVGNTGAVTAASDLNLTGALSAVSLTVTDGVTSQTISSSTGVAALGTKNSLSNVRVTGRRSGTGAPTTGGWTAGDSLMDAAGTWWLCTVSGTPGTWVSGSSDLNLPADQNLLAWTYDPDMAGHVTAQSNAGVAGRITLTRIVLRNTFTWSNIWIGLSGVDAAATLSNCYLGVYDTAGTLLGVTADLSASLLSGATARSFALTTPFTAAPGSYFIAMLLNGTWTTNSLTFKASGAGISVNAGLVAPNLRYSNLLTGQTSLPSSLTLANQTTTIISTGWASQWYGVS